MKKSSGFTLIELMIVVAIIGVLSSIAIPTFVRFIKKAKTTEATLNIQAIAKGTVAWFHEEHTDSNGNPMSRHFPSRLSPTSYPPNAPSEEGTFAPTVAPCGSLSKGAMYLKNQSNWNSYPWLALHYSVNRAHYFQYYYGASLKTPLQGHFAVIVARGDFDCDGELSTYITNIEPSVNGFNSEDILIREVYVINGLE